MNSQKFKIFGKKFKHLKVLLKIFLNFKPRAKRNFDFGPARDKLALLQLKTFWYVHFLTSCSPKM